MRPPVLVEMRAVPDGLAPYGTDPLDACPDDTSDNAWPPDTDNTGSVSIMDVLLYKPILGGPYNSRYDLNTNDTVNIMDVLLYKPVIGTSCAGP